MAGSLIEDRRHLLLTKVVLPAAAAMIALALLVGAVLSMSAAGSDEAAVARQTRLAKIGLRQGWADIRKTQEASTNWDDAAEKSIATPLDAEWMDQNLGVWFYTYYKYDHAYLLDHAGRPLYAMVDGKRHAPEAFSAVSQAVLPFAADLHRRLKRGDTAAPPGELTPSASGLTRIHGRPAIVSVKPILSETGEVALAPGAERLHVIVRYMDGSFLQTLSSIYGIDAASFSTVRSSDASLQLRDTRGNIVGYIQWTAFRPGRQVADRMVPVLAVALLLVGAVLLWLLSRVLRSRLELEASRAQAQHLAFHDPLTALPNRALFEDRLSHALVEARQGGSVAIMLLDLDRFKNVNDTLGHLAGDALIKEFGRRLSALLAEGDTIARLGGDEFGILLTGAGARAEIEILCARVLMAVHAPFPVLGSEAHVGVSIGVVFAPESGTDRTELLRKADIALYRAKEDGRDCFRVFEPDMDATVRLRSSIEDDLRRALDRGDELSVHYQPQISGAGHQIVGVEALARWTHPTRGAIAPEQFIPIAEATGQIRRLGAWVMREACIASRRWPDLVVSVNLSPVQFRSADLFETLTGIVRETGADARMIQLEVTEGILLDDDALVRTTLTQLRSVGFTIALDDFGTGYSSLSYLRRFEVDRIKIDRSFIQALGQTVDSAAIVSAVLSLGQAMGLAVTAEGVETAEQRRFLEAAGCSEMQGFLFAPAMPAEEIDTLLIRSRLTDAA
ncbi:putative bifunctional diguanylate cyclase/phosphodiesterase [Allosphingosinicella deserti]|uniref:Bifunctional diguanylate cyclase/phosphodiesterase n=1 Tax=Allosphingosinicella deserti TaxID=2116704 RepID=A0A2P7QZ16_9SPHN|nr:EAL domain-containing protein [Sphingomonas deserti]PSJ43208.1 bifunctional diguanylate cyclase/phosphodiesterase [Sphingomonas deserti]